MEVGRTGHGMAGASGDVATSGGRRLLTLTGRLIDARLNDRSIN